MTPNTERITWRTLVGLLVLAVLLAAVAAPIAVWGDAASRLLVIRLAAALFCAIALFRLVVAIRQEAGIEQISAAEMAKRPRQETAQADPLLAGLAAELRRGIVPRPIGSAVHQRLQRLGDRRGIAVPAELPGPGDVERAVSCLEDAQ